MTEFTQHGFKAKVVEDSVNEAGVRLTTMQLRYPRFIHAEAKTHRVLHQGSEELIVLTRDEAFMADPMLSRNASSSRAIPVAKMIKQVREEPAMPIHWGKNQPGMQANEELDFEARSEVMGEWRMAANNAADSAEFMAAQGAHKQVVNRILEPFQFISVVVTATEWANFFELRDHADAQPEIKLLAQLMKQAMNASTPMPRDGSYPKFDGNAWLTADTWHLPYVTGEERRLHFDNPQLLVKLSTARCARVSYLTHDGQTPSIEKDIELHDRLVAARPIHASPAEHAAQAQSGALAMHFFKNFRGWRQYRADVEFLLSQS